MQQPVEEKEDLAILERINRIQHFLQEKSVKLSDYINPELITFLHVADQKEGLNALVDLLDEKGELKDRGALFSSHFRPGKYCVNGHWHWRGHPSCKTQRI